MKIILTSFRDAKNYLGSFPFSIARSQPKGFMFPSLRAFAPVRKDGSDIKHLPPDQYRSEYEIAVLSSEETLRHVTNTLSEKFKRYDTILLCCWCNPTRQDKYEKLMCHRILVGYWLEKHTDFEILFADGAENPIWER